MTIPFAELRKKWKMDPDFRKEYEAPRIPSSSWRETSSRRAPRPD